jgi:hypothetical protein
MFLLSKPEDRKVSGLRLFYLMLFGCASGSMISDEVTAAQWNPGSRQQRNHEARLPAVYEDTSVPYSCASSSFSASYSPANAGSGRSASRKASR